MDGVLWIPVLDIEDDPAVWVEVDPAVVELLWSLRRTPRRHHERARS
jgi:hypothetical protein